jgi:predicted transport protein
MAKTPEEMEASMIANLADKTGKSLDQWIAIAKASGHAKHGELVKFLKTEHGMGHGYANLVAHRMKGSAAISQVAAGGGDDLVESQYSGKEDLRPIYDALAGEVRKFGGDVELAPKKAYVSLRRKKQFGLIQPSTKTRLDVGINLKGVDAGDRLEASGSWNSMVSHRVRLSEKGEVDGQLVGWLKQAYEQAG